MHILIIDTSGKQAQVALVRDRDVLAQRVWDNSPQVGIHLLEHIEAVLQEVGGSWSQVERIAVHRGPREDVLYFSGLRTGITTAMILSSAKQIPVAGVSGESFDALVRMAGEVEPEQVVVPQYQG